MFRIDRKRLFLMLLLATVVVTGIAAHHRYNARPVSSSFHGIPLAVLGDSDSHIYHDPVNHIERGGAYHHVTYQWTEILDALRPGIFDLGEKNFWGSMNKVAGLKRFFGLSAKAPPKYDYKYNYAFSGMKSASLLHEWPRQTHWLLGEIAHDRGWNQGVVVIRIGINDIGQINHLQEYVKKGITEEVRRRVESCAHHIADTVQAIRQANDSIRIVLVGIADNSSAPFDKNMRFSPEDKKVIRSVLDMFDTLLEEIATHDDKAVFMDDRFWLQRYWPEGKSGSAEESLELFLGGGVGVTKTWGDHPRNLILADGHAGTVANGLWTRELIELLNHAFGFNISPLLDEEIAALADPFGEYGIAPEARRREQGHR
jgi:hypothetical protein